MPSWPVNNSSCKDRSGISRLLMQTDVINPAVLVYICPLRSPEWVAHGLGVSLCPEMTANCAILDGAGLMSPGGGCEWLWNGCNIQPTPPCPAIHTPPDASHSSIFFPLLLNDLSSSPPLPLFSFLLHISL